MMRRFHIHLMHRKCLACMVVALVPVVHLLESWFPIPHGLEVHIETFAASLVVSE